MNIAFFGTGDFSKNILESILEFEKINVKLVVSQIDKPVGRKKILEKTPVKILAIKNNIEVLQPEKLKNNLEFFEKLKNLDFIVVVAYGKIVPLEVLEAPKYGCINVHGSILPKYRGASPIQESIKNGDKKTGITIMYMAEGMDTGNILDIEKVEILKTDKTTDIFKKFEKIAPKILLKTLEKIISKKIKGEKQDDSNATYCKKIKKEDGEIKFLEENAGKIYNKFRAYYSWPGIYSYYNGKKISFEEIELFDLENKDIEEKERINKILENKNSGEIIKINKKTIGIVTKDKKILILRQIKLEGKKSMDILSFINGNKEFVDYKF